MTKYKYLVFSLKLRTLRQTSRQVDVERGQLSISYVPSFYIASGIVVVLCCRYCLEWALGIIRAAAMQMNRILMQCETTYKLRRERLIAFLINCCIVKVSLRTRSNIPTKMDFYFLLSTTATKLCYCNLSQLKVAIVLTYR